jgi:hypothetical protein
LEHGLGSDSRIGVSLGVVATVRPPLAFD